ncbi:Fpg/Nei family DNA glycosylase [Cellulomonas sp. NS3]|uniref:Fpg/Nei family DNA glycosylase n=1 Tax=Cellulomonas sp. NS3 TaxID=2973977 RepID=UPI0021639C73|nr:DNA-formamidopyrimidine glycosylase family protein [Cellulomonas sp. NS3]
MPEGDILRRTATRMDLALAGRVLVRAELRWPSAATVDLVGRTVLENVSYGKHLLTRFDDGRTLHTHLRMEGSWRIARTGTRDARASGTWVRAVLGNELWTTVGERLGMLDVVPTSEEHTLVGHLGPDILAPDFPTVGLVEGLRRWGERGSEPVCDVMLDQRVVAGMGTIYMAEPLFAVGLWPWTPADEVPDPERLLAVARAMMLRSVEARIPTATGEQGFRATSRVHGRAGQPCRRCGTPIEKGQARKPPMERPVFYCPRCQHP